MEDKKEHVTPFGSRKPGSNIKRKQPTKATKRLAAKKKMEREIRQEIAEETSTAETVATIEEPETVLEEPKIEKAPERKKRVALGVPRSRLAVSTRKGYVRRWINDQDGRILRAQEGGYNFVTSEESEFRDADTCNRDPVCKEVNSDGTKGYLMEISQEFYDEDQIEKKKLTDITEEALRTGEDSHGKPGLDGRYIPSEGIKITN